MNQRNRVIGFWAGYAFFPAYLLGFVVVAGFIPPPAPSLDAAQLAQLFEQQRLSILCGMAICAVASALYVPWCVSIFGVMLRMESGFPALAWIQLLSGCVGAVFFLLSPLVWAALAYRTGHDPDTVQILNDFAWISWIVSWPPFLVQEFAVGLCALSAKGDQRLIPRWLAFFALYGSSTMVPALIILFVTRGPFAWDGMFGLYLPLVVFSIWFHLISYAVWRANRGGGLRRPDRDALPLHGTACHEHALPPTPVKRS